MNRSDPLKRIRVVLVRPSHPGNIGAAARAMKTMGLDDLVLVAPQSFPDPAARARASGAADVLERARVVATLDAALADTVLAVATTARGRELRHEIVTARAAAARLVHDAAAGTVALVFGNETSGLTGEEAGRCPLLACIPANPGAPALLADPELAAIAARHVGEGRSAAFAWRAATAEAAAAVSRIVEKLAMMGVEAPIIGDFHYNGQQLLTQEPACAEALAKYRINPGNVGLGKKKDTQFATLIELAIRHGKPVRIGANGARWTRHWQRG